MREIRTADAVASWLVQAGCEGAVFDIDGTLIDSMGIWNDLGARYLVSLGKVPQDHLGEILYPMTIAQGVSYLKKTYGLAQSEKEIRDGLNHITEVFYKEQVPLKKGALEFLEALRKHRIPMVLATIGEKELEAAALKRLGVWEYFDGMYCCEDYGTTKKEARIYEICAEALKLPKEKVLVVEDVYQAVHSAHTAGFLTAGIQDEASRQDEEKICREADFFLKDFETLEVK